MIPGQRCENCRFVFQVDEDYVECRRNPPTIAPGVGHEETTGIWPDVLFGDWCGEWQQRTHWGHDAGD